MKTIFVTGAAGYVGEMLCEQLAKRDDVRLIVGLDKEPQSEFSRAIPKLTYIQANLADETWQDEVAKHEPEIMIHTAWQIRAMYGQSATQWRWNVDGSNNVFDLSFDLPSVKKLIYFSTASGYSARVDNSLDHYFTEAEGFREDDYIYALEKKVAEENLYSRFEQSRHEGKPTPQVFVLRPAAITGPRGRYMRIRFGLQSALQGNLKGGFVNRLVTLLTSYVPATEGWVRQFVHEDDVSDAVTLFAFQNFSSPYEVYNLTPTGEPVRPKDMAEAVGKKIIPIKPWMARLAFAFFWHGTRGRIPTCPGSWRFYSYPVLMSGEKLAQVYQCHYSSQDAFRYTAGRYEDFVPADLKKNKTQ